MSEETVTVSATESGWGVVRKTVCKPTGSLDHQTFNTSSMAVLTKSLLCILSMSWILVQKNFEETIPMINIDIGVHIQRGCARWKQKVMSSK